MTELRASHSPPLWQGPYSEAVELDATLGDPRRPDNPCGYAAMLDRAEGGYFPTSLADAGAALRLSYLPRADGGDLTTLDETLALVRMVARRDVTVMPATMMNITAAFCVLIAGSARQRARIVRILRSGGSIGFAFSEPAHGSDLLANSCSMQPVDGGGWRINGEKWLVGFGRRPQAVLLIAHSGGRGPAAYSTLLLDYKHVESSRNSQGQRPTGMRGIDFARFTFRDIVVPDDAVVGPLGRGMETAMKSMQVVRTMSAGANVAAVDSALRQTLDFARHHVVAGKPVDEHPHNRRELGTAGAMMLACDAVAVACARAMHTMPASQSLWSSVAKKVITDLSEEAFARCADVLGTRSVLREGPEGSFDVLRTDNRVVRYFDTHPMANLRLVSMHLNQSGKVPNDWSADRLAETFTLASAPPSLRPEALALSARGQDGVSQALPDVLAQSRGSLDTDTEGQLLALLDQLETGMVATPSDAADLLRTKEPALRATTQLDLAERFCYLHAAATCVHTWWFNRDRPLHLATPGSTGWLTPAVGLLLDRAAGSSALLPYGEAENAFDVLTNLHATERLFSAVPLPLAGSSGAHVLDPLWSATLPADGALRRRAS